MDASPDNDLDTLHIEIRKILWDAERALQEVRESVACAAKTEVKSPEFSADSTWRPIVVAAGLLGGGGALAATCTATAVAIIRMMQ